MRAVGCAGAGLATYEVEIHQNGERERVLHPLFDLTQPPVEQGYLCCPWMPRKVSNLTIYTGVFF